MNALKYFVCANYHISAALINYLDKYTCENDIFYLGDPCDFENDLST